MKPDSLRVPSAKPGARTYASPLKPVAVPAGGGAAHGKQAIPSEERRRSQRVLLRVRANIHVALQGKPVTLEATTLSVNTHGAIIVTKQSLPLETHLILEHYGTRERVACKVIRRPREMPEGFHIPIEFDSPAPDFWRIAFPPCDWRPPEDL